MKKYTIDFNFQTAKAGKGQGQVIGRTGSAQCDIEASKQMSIKDLKKHNNFLEEICKKSITTNPKLKTAGVIIGIKIRSIKEKQK
jgi:hypothetical protein